MTLDRAKTYAMNALASRMYTAKEMRDKLVRKGVDIEAIDEIIAALTAEKFINDELYAESYVIDGVNLKGKGLYRIRQELRVKGVAAGVIEDAVKRAEENIDTGESLRAVVEQRLGDTKFHSYKELEKFKAKLMYRGYSIGEIRECFEEMGIKVVSEPLEDGFDEC